MLGAGGALLSTAGLPALAISMDHDGARSIEGVQMSYIARSLTCSSVEASPIAASARTHRALRH